MSDYTQELSAPLIFVHELPKHHIGLIDLHLLLLDFFAAYYPLQSETGTSSCSSQVTFERDEGQFTTLLGWGKLLHVFRGRLKLTILGDSVKGFEVRLLFVGVLLHEGGGGYTHIDFY